MNTKKKRINKITIKYLIVFFKRAANIYTSSYSALTITLAPCPPLTQRVASPKAPFLLVS